MLRYEGLLLTIPQISQEEIANIESSVDKIIQSKQGSTVSFEKWGKYKLAYPVKKNEYGVYILIRFDVPAGTSTIDDMKMLFETKLNNIIMRTMFTRLDNEQTLAYQRPKSLEETPAREEFSPRDRDHRDRDRGDRDLNREEFSPRDRRDRSNNFYVSNEKEEEEGKDEEQGEF